MLVKDTCISAGFGLLGVVSVRIVSRSLNLSQSRAVIHVDVEFWHEGAQFLEVVVFISAPWRTRDQMVYIR